MATKITDQTMLGDGDLVKIVGEDGIVVYEVRTAKKTMNLGAQIICKDHTAKQVTWYQMELIGKDAEVISTVELMALFAETQKALRKHEEEAIHRAITEDLGDMS